jgi:hypothetical protein
VKIEGSAPFDDPQSGCSYTRTESGRATYRFASRPRTILVAGTIPARGTYLKLDVTAGGGLEQTTSSPDAACPAMPSVDETYAPKKKRTSLSLAFFPFTTRAGGGPQIGFAPKDSPAYLSSEKNLFGRGSLLGEQGGFLPQGLKKWSFSQFRHRRFVIKNSALSKTGVDLGAGPRDEVHCTRPGTGSCIARIDRMHWTATFTRAKSGASGGRR